MTDVWESNVYDVGIAKCCLENEIDVYWMEINYVYYVRKMYMTWSYNCLLKGGKGWLLQKHGNGYSTGELNGCG
jgi:hypothetical protein